MLKIFYIFTCSQFIGLDDDIDEFDEDKGDIAQCALTQHLLQGDPHSFWR